MTWCCCTTTGTSRTWPARFRNLSSPEQGSIRLHQLMYTADTEARITIPVRLEAALERYRGGLEAPPSLASVVQAALEEYLEDRGYPVGAGEVFEDEQEIMPAASPRSRGRRFD